MSLTRTMRFVFAALVATIAMGAAVSTANAATGASVTNGVTLAAANGSLTLTAGINIICDVTLGLALNRSIAKTTGAQIGSILLSGSGSNIANCNGGVTGVVLNGITVGYASFTGDLPDIETINGLSRNAAFQLNIPAIRGTCLYTGSVPATFNRDVLSGAIDTVDLSASNSLASSGPSANCPSPGSLRGTLTVLATKPIIQLI